MDFHRRQGKRLEEPEKELELDVFGVEDVTDVGGEPLFQSFTFEDGLAVVYMHIYAYHMPIEAI